MAAASQLERMIAAIAATSTTRIASKKRAGVAAVLRVYSAQTGLCIGGESASAVAKAAGEDTSAQLEMLFLKRALRKRDPWSGNVALPGGHRDPEDADDKAAAQRECLEEAGLDLGGRDFAYLGPLDQRPIYAGGRKAKGFTMCPFVWLQTAPQTPPLLLQPSEIAAAVWCPLGAISQQALDFHQVKRDLQPHTLPVLKHVPVGALEALGATSLHFPSVDLPFNGATQQPRSAPRQQPAASHLHLPAGSPFAAAQQHAAYSTARRGEGAAGSPRPVFAVKGRGKNTWIHHAVTTTAFRAASMSTRRETAAPPQAGDSQDAQASEAEVPAADAPNTAARTATAAALRHSKPHGADGSDAAFTVNSPAQNTSFGPEGQALADGTGAQNTATGERNTEEELPELQFQLWGLTLGVTSDLLALTHKRPQVPLNWPPLRLPGAIPNGMAWAAWGYLELRDYPRYSLSPKHVGSFAALCATGVAAVLAAASMVAL